MADIWMDVDTALSEVPVNIMPLVDDTDFKTREDAIAYNAAGMDLRWNFVTTAGAYTSTAVTPTTSGDYDWTHQGDGMYSIEIPASGGASINNNTEGFGWFVGFVTGVLPWRGPIIGFRAAALNNSLIDGATLDVNVTTAAGTAWNSGAIGANTLASNTIAAAKIASGAITSAKFASGAITATVIAADAIGASELAADAVTEIQSGLATSSALATVDSNVDLILEDTGTTLPGVLGTPSDFGSGTSTLAANLQDMADNGTATFDRSTDSLQAIRDRGDAAWTTGSGADVISIASGTIGATGNDTTHLHLTGLTFGDDELNGYLIRILDVSASEYHSRWIEDWADTGDLATVDTLPFTPQDSTDTYVVLAIKRDFISLSSLENLEDFFDGTGYDATASSMNVTQIEGSDATDTITGSVPTAAAIADAVLDEALSGHTTAGTLGKAIADIETDATAILADTDELQTNQGDWATATGFSTHSAADVRTEMDSNSTQLAAIIADTGTDGVVISTTTQNAIADAILDRNMATGTDSGGRTVRNALRALRNKVDVASGIVYKEDDSTTAWAFAVTTNASANPITIIDPS